MQVEQFDAFLESQQLPKDYITSAFKAYQVVIDDVLARLKTKKPFILGINGSQGSGKSTTAAFLQHALQTIYHLNVVNISLDDFYLSKHARHEKSKKVHPLFATRGVPGTHDTELALITIQNIILGKSPFISRFNKAVDDLFPEEELRGIRSLTGDSNLENIFDFEENILKIGPFKYEMIEQSNELLNLPDEIFLEFMSTSPKVESENFVLNLKNSLKFLIKNPDYKKFFKNESICYKMNENGIWNKI